MILRAENHRLESQGNYEPIRPSDFPVTRQLRQTRQDVRHTCMSGTDGAALAPAAAWGDVPETVVGIADGIGKVIDVGAKAASVAVYLPVRVGAELVQGTGRIVYSTARAAYKALSN